VQSQALAATKTFGRLHRFRRGSALGGKIWQRYLRQNENKSAQHQLTDKDRQSPRFLERLSLVGIGILFGFVFVLSRAALF
jgi:hypothetical protein